MQNYSILDIYSPILCYTVWFGKYSPNNTTLTSQETQILHILYFTWRFLTYYFSSYADTLCYFISWTLAALHIVVKYLVVIWKPVFGSLTSWLCLREHDLGSCGTVPGHMTSYMLGPPISCYIYNHWCNLPASVLPSGIFRCSLSISLFPHM
jgi:hypothetical protein